MDKTMSPTADAKNWSTTDDKMFDRKVRRDEDVDVERKNSSARLSFSVDSLLSSIRQSKKPDQPEVESEKPEMDDDDVDDDAELDVEDDETEAGVGSSPSIHPVHPGVHAIKKFLP
jgi:hypothetical protein